MGLVKSWMIEMEERGYAESDDHICKDCVDDDALADWITRNAIEPECSFCGAEADGAIAASFEEFTAVILTGLGFDWHEPTHEGIMYISAEGGWQASLSTTHEVLWDAGFTENEDVIEALVDMIDCEAWVEREFYRGTDSQRLTWGWDSFKAFTKNHTRFFFLQSQEEDSYGEVTPAEMLGSISEMILSKLADQGLLRIINQETDLIRIRVADEHKNLASEIGTPNPEFALQSNRMSPAGIPMFYGAFDFQTAHAETFDPQAHEGKSLSVGTFRSLRDLTVLDLANLPSIPSVFDQERHRTIHSLRFLHQFARDISQPIARDGHEHIDYVPTQIVTEYFRRVFRLKDGNPIDGILYRSAKNADGQAFVLFCENHQCVSLDDQPVRDEMVRLIAVAHI